MNILLIGAFLLSLSSCSSYRYRRPESVEAKMARFRPQRQVYRVPKIVLPELSDYSTPARGPASVKKKPVKTPNKSLYFLTLWEQYRSFAAHSSRPRENLRSCPSLHNVWVERKENAPLARRSLMGKTSYKPDARESAHPELSLPLRADVSRPRVIDRLGKGEGVESLVRQAVDVHIDKIHGELRELCESGVSENYYAWENLMRHAREKGAKFSPSKNNLRALFKTTLFVNEALLRSLAKRLPAEERAPASADGRGKEHSFRRMMRKAGVSWSGRYLDSLK